MRLIALNVEAFLQKPISLARFEHAVLSLMDERQFTLDLEKTPEH